MCLGWFYKLALLDFETIFECVSPVSEGAMRALRPSEMVICTRKESKIQQNAIHNIPSLVTAVIIITAL